MRKFNKNSKTIKKKRRNQFSWRGYQLANQNTYSNRESPFITGIDPHKYVTLKYLENYTNTVLTTAGAQQTMNINSIFDPNRTGVGHQPLYFDQYSALYNRYRVLNTRWKITFGNTTGTYNVVVLPLNGLLVASVAGQTTYETACEQPRAVYKIVPGNGGYPVTISGAISLSALNGCTKTEYLGDDRFEAQISASPTEIMTLNIGLYNPTTATVIINFTVELFFEVDLHDVISISGS